jgi:hypothetical protein
MPMVNGKKYPYTQAGKKAAKKAAKKKTTVRQNRNMGRMALGG